MQRYGIMSSGTIGHSEWLYRAHWEIGHKVEDVGRGQITSGLECQAKEIIPKMYPAQRLEPNMCSVLVLSPFLFPGVHRAGGVMMRVAEGTKVVNI